MLRNFQTSEGQAAARSRCRALGRRDACGHAVTGSKTAAACPSCGVFSTAVKGQVSTSPRDIPYGENRIIVRWNKTRWRCREDYCERGSFTESIEQVPAGRGLPGGCAPRSARRSGMRPARWPRSPPSTGCRGRPRTARSSPTPRRCWAEPEPTRVLGIDETRRGKPRWTRCELTRRWVRVDPWDTGFVDLAGSQGLLGQREGRTGAAVIDWLRERTPQFRDAIEFVTIDPAAVYASAIRTRGLLPNAQIVVDHFHLVKLGNDALTKVRRRVTWELRDHRGRKLDPEWANRRRLLRARERLSQSSFARMWNTIIDEDPSAQDLSAWIAKGVLRTLLSTVVNRSNASDADSATQKTPPAGYDSTAPANSGQQPRLQAHRPVKIEDDI